MSSRLACCLLLWTCRPAILAVGTRTVGRLDFVVGVPRLVHEHKIHEQETYHADRTAGRRRRILQNKGGGELRRLYCSGLSMWEKCID